MSLCGVIATPTVAQAREAMAHGSRWADVFELRLDYLDQVDLRLLLEDRPRPVIVTCRPKWEGGCYEGPEEKRLEILREADRLGAEYIDIEARAFPCLGPLKRARSIVSSHDFDQCPDDLEGRARELRALGGDIVKIAVMARDGLDGVRMLHLLKGADFPLIGLCMGEFGHATRILGPIFGSLMTYAVLPGLPGSAPGQLDARDLSELYRIRQVGQGTRVFGVMGYPIAHSMSPLIHNRAFQSLGLDAIYVPFAVRDQASDFVKQITAWGCEGLSVTVPHKEEVLKAMDWVDPVAAHMGAMNTVCRSQGLLRGYNTDWVAAVKSIEQALPGGSGLSGARALVFGAGGVARAVVYGLKQRGAAVVVVNRTPEKARRLAEEAGCDWADLAGVTDRSWDVLAHCTTVGMWPDVDQCLVPDGLLKNTTLVYDTVYNPLETELLRRAKSKGCIGVSGLRHFVLQAAEQFKLWMGQEAPQDVMEEALRERLSSS